ncbi:LacI family DNA-binding transcriptional regulator [Oceaniglobus trochenteri]|uniref:LacI family DNA-binding transcriptional regulator n=1 Tax=Oceaniglobus trochenteri TaxID=2763260 RepID=UPI001CFF8CA5|nr:LacI family DNA-binding transcriptional regulator [Oceaniglobus trochenteri]
MARPPNPKPVTMKDVARAAGVSVMTVSRAFKADTSVNSETRARIHAVAEEMGYVFDVMAANLRAQKSDFVAVTIPTLSNANFADTVDALSRGLAGEGLQVLLGYDNYDVDEEERLIEQLLRRRPEAIVVTGGTHTPRTRRLLGNAGIPVVEIWDLPADPIGHVVGFSNAGCIEDMVDHLVAKGYRRIAFIGGDPEQDTRGADRKRGFLRAMRRHGLDAGRAAGVGRSPASMQSGARALTRIMAEHPDTQAVVCVADQSAFGALTECMRRGIRVPEDLAIAGFGAFEVAAICVPTLTTIDPLPGRIGARTAELLLALRAGTAPDGPQTISITPALRLAQSTGDG